MKTRKNTADKIDLLPQKHAKKDSLFKKNNCANDSGFQLLGILSAVKAIIIIPPFILRTNKKCWYQNIKKRFCRTAFLNYSYFFPDS